MQTIYLLFWNEKVNLTLHYYGPSRECKKVILPMNIAFLLTNTSSTKMKMTFKCVNMTRETMIEGNEE